MRVSTVFVGLDHGYDRRGPTTLFETMTFGRGGDPEDDWDCVRYSTWAEAQLGHDRMVERVRASRRQRNAV